MDNYFIIQLNLASKQANTLNFLMQLYALEDSQKIVSAPQAQKHKNYFCIECEKIVRLRGGMHRQKHFYHLSPSSSCKQAGKSLSHLQIQKHIKRKIGDDKCRMEVPFPSIRRIADLFWEEKKIVFEIQCSSITAQEVKKRNQDYSVEGYQTVWILHDKRFNRNRFSAAEKFLASTPHYFSDIDPEGKGKIYDQFYIFYKGFRIYPSCLIEIDISDIQKNPLHKKKSQFAPSPFIQKRLLHWPIFFSEDLISVFLASSKGNERQKKVFATIQTLENKYKKKFPSAKKHQLSCLKNAYERFIKKPLAILFQILLESVCR